MFWGNPDKSDTIRIVLATLLILASVTLSNMLLELTAVDFCVTYLRSMKSRKPLGANHLRDALVLGVSLGILLIGHLLQIAIWAGVFVLGGEFGKFETAFYHSAVNFASLGYGDIVMSERWRLFGAIEAAVGVMMFGVSAALLFAIINKFVRIRLGLPEAPSTD